MTRRDAAEREFLDLLAPLRLSIERYALRNAWNQQQASDIVQEAVMTAWRQYDRFEPGTDFKAWMFRILVNTIYSFNKKTRRDRQLRVAAPVEELDWALERENSWPVILEDSGQVLEQLDDRLVAALDSLSADERQCLLLRLLEGFTYKEISGLLDMPLGTVMSHVHRARLKLRERLSALAVEMGLIQEVLP